MAQVQRVTIPYSPRHQFLPFHDRKQRWAIGVAHRRCGKTVATINDLVRGALTCPLPNPRLAYLAPYYAQAKDVAWGYLKQFGLVIPGAEANESEMRVDFPTGGRVRLYGADNYDRMRGIYLDGVVLDEYADMDPRVWPEIIRPALSDRKGWAAFIGTPKGRNDFAKMYEKAIASPEEWFAFMLRASETGIIAEAELADAKRMMTAEQYEQEYECSFDAAVIGAYYGKDMALADAEKRICSVPYDKAANVVAAMDIGIGDSTAIWWAQIIGREVHILDYYEAAGVGADHYVEVINSKPFKPETVILPHDGNAREFQTGKSRKQFLEGRGLNCIVLENHRVEDGINAVRMMLNRCWFDRTKCERGIEVLRMYRAEYDDKLRSLRPRPLHDWASHGADAFRYLAMGIDDAQPKAAFNRDLEYQPLGIH